MKLIESDGKKLLAEAGIRVPAGVFVAMDDLTETPPEGVPFPCFAKAQVLRGRRGKAGLVKRIKNAGAWAKVVAEIRAAAGETPCAGLLLEEDVPHAEEWLVSVNVDGASGMFRVSVSDAGGMGVTRARMFLADPAAPDASDASLPDAVQTTVSSILRAMTKLDALSIEINPLAVCNDGSGVALDAKIELDDAAAFRHAEWSELQRIGERATSERERAYADLLANAGHKGTLGRYVELNGDIAVVLSGGGASLAAMDALVAAGGRPSNYVEMSGNPDPEAVTKAAKIVLSKPGIRAVWIAGSFANFTDIQATVNATLRAIAELGLRVPVVIRRDGPNADKAVTDALAWGAANGISVRFDRAEIGFDESARAVVEALKKE